MKKIHKSILLILIFTVTLISCNKDGADADIFNITPTSGTKGTIVTINGDGFGISTRSVSVFFNGKEAEVIDVKNTVITVKVPEFANTGNIKIIVNNVEFIGPEFTYLFSDINVSLIAGSGTVGLVNATGAVAQFNTPLRAAVDDFDNIFVTDYGNNIIRKITPTGVVTNFAGSGATGSEDGNGENASFNKPWGITIDSQNNLFVTDYGNHIIRKITPTGAVTTVAGLAGTTGNIDGPRTAARFTFPSGIAIDSGDRLFIADSNNHKIRMIKPNNGEVVTFAGTTSGNTDGTSDAKFKRPFGIVIDSEDNLFVADTDNYRIRKITPNGVVTTFAGSETGDIDGIGTEAKFSTIWGIAIDIHNNLFIPDNGNNKIKTITPSGLVTTISGTGVTGYLEGVGANALFNRPYGMAVDSQNNLIVVDTYNHRIRKITLK